MIIKLFSSVEIVNLVVYFISWEWLLCGFFGLNGFESKVIIEFLIIIFVVVCFI